jgi:hypothetical protein
MQEEHKDWQQRVDRMWAAIDDYGREEFPAKMKELTAELPADNPLGPFELGSAFDSTGYPEKAIPLYRQALDFGLSGQQRRRATIQMASSLRNLGEVEKSVALLSAEMVAESGELDDEVSAFLALALADSGHEREALSLALAALAPHLMRYQVSMARYAKMLIGEQ